MRRPNPGDAAFRRLVQRAQQSGHPDDILAAARAYERVSPQRWRSEVLELASCFEQLGNLIHALPREGSVVLRGGTAHRLDYDTLVEEAMLTLGQHLFNRADELGVHPLEAEDQKWRRANEAASDDPWLSLLQAAAYARFRAGS